MRSLADLHGYQNRAITALYETPAVQLVVPMGGGKTVIAQTAIAELIRDGAIRHATVLAPKRVAQLVWPVEKDGWEQLRHLRVEVVVAGSAAEREAALARPADIHVVGIDNAQWLVEWLKKQPADSPWFDLLCIDELSRFKSGKRAKALKGIAPKFGNRWGLTGTPRPNGYQDQWMPLKLVSGGAIWPDEKHLTVRGGYDGWIERYFMALDFHGHRISIRPEWRNKIIADINAWTVAIDPNEMPELPELTQVVHWVELPPSVMKTYKQMERDLLATIVRHDAKGRPVVAANAAVASGKLAQIAQGFIYDEAGAANFIHAAKSDQLVDLIDDLDGDPVLTCYGFKEDLSVLQELYPGLPYLGAGVSDSKAAAHEAAWNRCELPLLGLHPASAGHGLNLQHGGSQMIWFCLPWSSEQFDQTRKRYWRQGQMKRCFEHIILAKNTVDEVKFDRVVNKMTEQEAFVKYLNKV